MPAKTASTKPMNANDRPGTGPTALLQAMGFSAVQVAQGVIALQTTVKKAA